MTNSKRKPKQLFDSLMKSPSMDDSGRIFLTFGKNKSLTRDMKNSAEFIYGLGKGLFMLYNGNIFTKPTVDDLSRDASKCSQEKMYSVSSRFRLNCWDSCFL
ncbi:uncharacterized protein LOC106998842 isoform X1 [Macaca mulatta]